MEDEFQIPTALLIFLADAIFFFLTASYINTVIRSKAVNAGFVALMQNFSSYVALYFFVRHLGYIVPACFAAFVGTWSAIKYDSLKQKNQKDELAELREELAELREEIKKLKKEETKRIENFPKKVIKIH